jgi:preprotein translocase subunit YajC
MQGKEILFLIIIMVAVYFIYKMWRNRQERMRQHYRNEGRLQELDRKSKESKE